MADERYSVKELADRTGVTPRTVYYYVSEGLLPPPEGGGPASTYGVEHLARLELIRRLKDEFLPLAEIRRRLEGLSTGEILALLDAPREPAPPDDARAYLRQVLGPRTADAGRSDSRRSDRAGRFRRTEKPSFCALPVPPPVPPPVSSPRVAPAPAIPDAAVPDSVAPDAASLRGATGPDAGYDEVEGEPAAPSAFATPWLAAPQHPAPQRPAPLPPEPPVDASPGRVVPSARAVPDPPTLADEVAPAAPRLDTFPEPTVAPSPPMPSAQTWERLRISDEVELHVRQGTSPGARRRIARMVDALRRILRD
ncbi:MAG: MerR family transcriptional regulator [Chloroflexi bacterium]|nr:MerR family transcriptional regulator [Chloroflexota bacterium]